MTAVRARAALAVVAVVGLAGCSAAGAADSGPAPHTVTLALRGEHRAALAVLTGAASVTVRAVHLPGQLVRAWTPRRSGVRPRLVQAGDTVRVYQASTGSGGPDSLSIDLSSAVRWQLRLAGGSSQATIDMRNGAVSGIDVTAGSSRILIALPRPDGLVMLTLAGGASDVRIRVPAGVPVQLQLWGGAGSATLNDQSRTGIGAGTVLTDPSWAGALYRYDVSAPAGLAAIQVTS
jgi:hypothetical protein